MWAGGRLTIVLIITELATTGNSLVDIIEEGPS